MMDQREFIVQLVVSSTHQYVVDARTEEEAIAQAEGMLEDEEYGDRLGFEIEISEAFSEPLEEEEEDDE
jgi:hypothetical protein